MTMPNRERYSEADTRAKLIDPALHKCGWNEDMIRREETAGAILTDDEGAFRSDQKRADYTLRVFAKDGAQPVAVALIEAKRNTDSPGAGLEQCKRYARRFNVPFVYSSNGHRFVEYDNTTKQTSEAREMAHFPAPGELRARYEDYCGFSLDDDCAKPLSTPYDGGESARRYYQDAAIRAALEKTALAAKDGRPARALLSLATGSGKTFIATHLLKRVDDAKQMKRALFLCDRDSLRAQALAAFRRVFGNDAEAVRIDDSGRNIAEFARVHIATYQTLGISGEEEKSPGAKHYPENHFSHIIIDECHRSAWNKWSEILRRNPKAAQIGLTATPRKIGANEDDDNREINDNNIKHFDEPVYEYSLTQGAEDGYLALCRIETADINLDNTGVTLDELMAHNPVNYLNGEPLTREQLKKVYEDRHFEGKLVLPDRVEAMCRHLFNALAKSRHGPCQKTVVFCVSDIHTQLVAAKMNNLYAEWCEQNNAAAKEPYAFRCTSDSDGNKELPDFRGETNHHFIATTVDLLSTGVDIPRLRNVVFFRYVKSPIALHQMIGRGARIDEPSGKLDFVVRDYTDATRLLGKDDWKPPKGGGGKRRKKSGETAIPVAEGFEVRVADTGDYIVVEDEDGKPLRLSAEKYRERVARRLLQEVKSADDLRAKWIAPAMRKELLKFLADEQCSPKVLRALPDMKPFDDFDILAELAYGALRRTREERAEMFGGKNEEWLNNLPPKAAQTLRVFAFLFAQGGVDELENTDAFQTGEVKEAGGMQALKEVPGAQPAELIHEAKRRLFAA